MFCYRSWSYDIFSDGTASIKLYSGLDTKAVIPSEINGFTVVKIDEAAFAFQSDIISITIPDTIKEIGSGAFFECCNLTDLIIPETVEKIESNAFYGCTGLADENGFVIVNNKLFGYFGYDEIVAVPTGIKTIEYLCFCDNKKIKIVILPDSVKKIKEYAFCSCTDLQRIEIASAECKVDKNAFGNCRNLREIVLPKYAEIKEKDIDGLTVDKLQPEENQPYVGWQKTKLEMPYKPWKYSNCKWKYATLSDGSAAITSYWGKDTKIVIPNEIDKLTVTEIAYKAFFANKNIVSVTIPDTVKKIWESAFCSCCCLSKVIIPETVEEIGKKAFHDCPCLADENGFAIVNNILYGYYGKSEIVTVPQGVEIIELYCFNCNENIKEVILPNSVTKIAFEAFYCCENLQKVEIANTGCEINEYAFKNCPSLTVEYKK